MNHLSIRTKIFLGTVIVSLCFITLTLFATDRLMGRISADQAALNLRTGIRAYDRFISLRRNLMAVQARSLAQAPHLRAVMNIPEVDYQTVWYTARQLFDLTDAPWMVLTDASGKLLANAADSTSHGEDLSWQPCVNQALEGKEHDGIWYYSGELLRIVAVPIALGEQILGTLVIGERLDDAHAGEIREFTGRDAMILHAGDLAGWSTEDSTAMRATLNLLSNARDALEAVPETTSSERTLGVSTELNSAHGVPRVGATVRDKGTGLGLPICKSIVEEFGGTLEITSDAGEGTEIRVFLPTQVSDPGARAGDSLSATLT